MNRHVTIATTAAETAIDDAISQGLQFLSDKHKETMDLVNVSTFHRPHDGILFVTIIAKGTGQARAVKSKEPKH